MRYHYEPPENWVVTAGRSCKHCKHPIYNTCTLYEKGFKCLAVIQQRYDSFTKHTWWGEIDPWLVDDIYREKRFNDIFEQFASEPIRGIYPTLTVRQIMWMLRMPPLPKEPWETIFERRPL